LPLLAAHLGLLLLGDLARHLEAALLLLAAGFAALAVAARRIGAGETGVVVGVALALRLLLLPLPPTLSRDLDRYLWDGRVAAAGENPYRLAPDARELAALRDARWERLDHRQVPTVYPPLALGLFALAASLPAPELAWKLLLSAADLGGCVALLSLARRAGVPLSRTVWYAWNPLVVLEVAGMGHLDALGVAAAVAAVAALSTGRSTLAGWAAAAGAMAKLVPLAAFPLWARASGRPGRFLSAALAATAALVVPWLATTGVPAGLSTYAVSWEFDGPLFEPLWRVLDGLGAPSAAARAVDALKRWSGQHDGLNRIYPYLYPQFLAKAALAAAMLTLVVRSVRRRDSPAGASGRLFGGVLLCSATVYPWYLLWVLPWAALARDVAWLALSGLILLTYLPQHRALPLWPGVFLAVWLPALALAVLARGRSRQASRRGPAASSPP
jgi:hypothetical protein